MSYGSFQRFSKTWAKQDSFKPIYSFNKVDDGRIGYSIRLVLFLATVAYVVYLHNNPELISEIKDAGIKSHDDIIQWGKEKIAFNFTNISHKTITYNKVIEEDDDEGQGDKAKTIEADSQNSKDADEVGPDQS